MSQLISIVIPTYNEAGNIDELLQELVTIPEVEIIVVDGGSSDRTPELVAEYPVKFIVTHPGRASQMNLGAKAAQGEILLFLHADSRLPEDFVQLITKIFRLHQSEKWIAGAFELEISGDLPGLRMVEKLVHWRSHLLQFPYGDQGIFLRAETFAEVGGFPDLPIMEDFQLVRQLQKLGKIAIVPAKIKTSPRRWQKLGVWQTTIINQLVIVAFFLRISPEKIANFYRRKK
jgi:rSAM/selenodomain-associated transferase 2